MSQQEVQFKVSEKTEDSKNYFEATVNVPGLKSAKVTKTDGTTRFSSASSARSAATRIAERNGWKLVTAEKPQAKQAAKKAARTTKPSSDAPASSI